MLAKSSENAYSHDEKLLMMDVYLSCCLGYFHHLLDLYDPTFRQSFYCRLQGSPDKGCVLPNSLFQFVVADVSENQFFICFVCLVQDSNPVSKFRILSNQRTKPLSQLGGKKLLLLNLYLSYRYRRRAWCAVVCVDIVAQCWFIPSPAPWLLFSYYSYCSWSLVTRHP